MRKIRSTYRHLDELTAAYQQRKNAIRRRLDEFATVRRDEYFYELVYCLLTPQSSAVNATKAIKVLKAADVFNNNENPAPLLHQRNFYIRFHNTKGRHILGARARFPEILIHLSNGSTSPELREWLVRNVKGLGWKESSHFLRNIGHRNLAILDRHILRNLRYHGVITAVPKTLTPKRYHVIEARFLAFADAVGISMDELDLLFWSKETGEILK